MIPKPGICTYPPKLIPNLTGSYIHSASASRADLGLSGLLVSFSGVPWLLLASSKPFFATRLPPAFTSAPKKKKTFELLRVSSYK